MAIRGIAIRRPAARSESLENEVLRVEEQTQFYEE